jgi:hypothetical protein
MPSDACALGGRSLTRNSWALAASRFERVTHSVPLAETISRFADEFSRIVPVASCQ